MPHTASTLITHHGLPASTESHVESTSLVPELIRLGIKSIILDWDGCVMPIRGDVHGAIALRALELSEGWQRLGITLTQEDATAAYEGDIPRLRALHLKLGGVGDPELAAHGVPWDQLMVCNLVALPLKASGLSPREVDAVAGEFCDNIPTAVRLIEHEQPPLLHPRDMNPGCYNFLQEAFRAGIPVHVVTMTPTVVVEYFAKMLLVSNLIASFQGCEQFDTREFPAAKLDKSLWMESARRKGLSISESAIIEDNRGNLQSAIESGAGAVVSLSLKGNSSLWMRAVHSVGCSVSGLWPIRPAGQTLLDVGFDYTAFDLPKIPVRS